MVKGTRESEPREPEYNQDTQREYAKYLETLKTFEPPPAHFDPLQASARELAHYGFPRRPNPETEGHLFPLWKKALSRPLSPVRAELEIDRVLLNRQHGRGKTARDGRFAPTGWGGIVARTSDFGFSPPEPANVVYGEWAIPSMEPDFDNPTTAMTVGFWVGLDGFTNNQVLQAGTAATVTGDKIDYWAWFEWFPDPPVRLTNFPINPGELVTVLVCAPQANHGFASMLNRTTGLTTSVGIPPRAGISSMGTSAEWIVEGISADLPNFVLAGFHHCTAGTKSHGMGLSRPIETEIAGAKGNLTVSVAWQEADTVLVLWEGIR
jgi:hypothetical protein